MASNPFQEELQRRSGVPQDGGGFTGEGNPFAEELTRRAGARGPVADAGISFFEGFNEELADLLDVPAEAAGAVLELIPGSENVPGLRRPEAKPEGARIGDIVRAANVREGGPETMAGRIASRAGQEVAATLPFALPGLAAGLAPRAVQPARTITQGVARALAEPPRHAPATAAGPELPPPIGAGGGAGLAQEVAPGNATAEFAGQLGGAAAPAAFAFTPSAILTRLVRAGGRRVSQAGQKAAARREVAEAIGGELTPGARENMRRAEELEREIPGFEPSLAERTGSPALSRTQQDIEGSAMGADLEALKQRRASNVLAVDRFANSVAPEGFNQPDFIIDAASGRATALRESVETAQRTAAERAEQLASRLPAADRTATGAAIRDRLTEAQRQRSARMTALAEGLGLNDDVAGLDFGPVIATAKDEFQLRGRFADPESIPPIIREVQDMDVNGISFDDWMSLRQRVSEDLRASTSGANPNFAQARNLTLFQARLDDLADQVLSGPNVPPELAANAQQFRRTYKTEFVDRFRTGAVFQVKARDGRGFFKTQDEKVADAFVRPKATESIRQYKTVLGDDLEAMAAIESSAIDSLRTAAVRDGRIVPRLYETWIRNHAGVLSELPNVKAKVDDIGNALNAVSRREADLAARSKRIGDDILVRHVSAVGRGSRTPEAALQSIVSNPRQLNRLLRSIRGNDAALGALKRHVWDQASTGSGQDTADFMEANQEMLRRVLGPDHWLNLRKITEARLILDRVPPSAGQGVSQDPLRKFERAMGQSPKQIASRMFAVRSGRTSPRIEAIDIFGRFLQGRRRAESEKLMREALFNPEVAHDMASILDSGEVSQRAKSRLNAVLLTIGAGTTRDDDQSTDANPDQSR